MENKPEKDGKGMFYFVMFILAVISVIFGSTPLAIIVATIILEDAIESSSKKKD